MTEALRRARACSSALLCTGLIALALHAGTAAAQASHPAELPAAIEGYVTETRGLVEWTFPESLRNRVEPLFGALDRHWEDISDELGVRLDRKLVVRVARNPGEMRQLAPVGASPPSYATGVAYPAWGVILLTFSAPDSWHPPDLDVVLAHEVSHIALFRALQGNPVPRWFSEGLAIHQSEVKLLPRTESLFRAAAKRSVLPLSELSGRFPQRSHDVNLAYAQSADIVGFLRRSDDGGQFQELISELHQGTSFDEALFLAYDWSPETLERQWRQSLRSRYQLIPLLFGGTTVWVFASLLLVMAYRRRRRRHHERLAEMEQQERASAAPKPAGLSVEEVQARAAWLNESGIPVIEHEGESHTLH